MRADKIPDDYECSGQMSLFEQAKGRTCGSCRFHQEVCRNAASAMYARAMEQDERCGKWQSTN